MIKKQNKSVSDCVCVRERGERKGSKYDGKIPGRII